MILGFGVDGEDSHPLLLIAMGKEDVDSLVNGKSIYKLAPRNPFNSPMRIIIVCGETQNDLARELEKLGLVPIANAIDIPPSPADGGLH